MLHNTIQGKLNGTGLRIAIVASRFNQFITDKLLEGCLDNLVRLGVSKEDIYTFWVPGAFEISFMATRLVDTNNFDALICIGTVIRGATPHFEYVSSESAKGIGSLNQKGKIPVIYGILTTDTLEQAIERAGTKGGNKGADAAMCAVEMANLGKIVEQFEKSMSIKLSNEESKSEGQKRTDSLQCI